MRRILISSGDPAGIGPEITLRATQALPGYELFVVGSRRVFERVASQLKLDLPQHFVDVDGLLERSPDAVEPGVFHAASAEIQAKSFELALDEIDAGRADAVVTAPWSKSLMPLIGRPTVGHTELLAARYPSSKHVMMLAGPRLRVSLVTTHLPLRAVPDTLSIDRIVDVTRTTVSDLGRRFGITQPRIAVLGLNPHAGERGEMGREEIDTIAPAVARLQEEFKGVAAVSGPYPADTLFARFHPGAAQTPFDAVVCMYHDQGLIPLKALHFGQAINITLGLPILRTSVDHGSAYDIAWKGVADASSMRYAIESAAQMLEVQP